MKYVCLLLSLLVSFIALIILLFIFEWLNRFERLYCVVYILIHNRYLIQLFVYPSFSDFKEFNVFVIILLEAMNITTFLIIHLLLLKKSSLKLRIDCNVLLQCLMYFSEVYGSEMYLGSFHLRENTRIIFSIYYHF